MQVDINLSNVILGLLISLISLITWFLKQAVDHLRTQIESLHSTDKELRDEIHQLDKNSIAREDWEKWRKEIKDDHTKIYDRLNELLKGSK